MEIETQTEEDDDPIEQFMVNANCKFWTLREWREYQGLWPLVSFLKAGLRVATEEHGGLKQAAQRRACWRSPKSKRRSPQLGQVVGKGSLTVLNKPMLQANLLRKYTWAPLLCVDSYCLICFPDLYTNHGPWWCNHHFIATEGERITGGRMLNRDPSKKLLAFTLATVTLSDSGFGTKMWTPPPQYLWFLWTSEG